MGRASQEIIKIETMELVQRSYTGPVAGRTAMERVLPSIEITQEGQSWREVVLERW